jgi:hypothetical protein
MGKAHIMKMNFQETIKQKTDKELETISKDYVFYSEEERLIAYNELELRNGSTKESVDLQDFRHAENKTTRILKYSIMSISVAIFILSLTQKALSYSAYNGPGDYYSIDLFIMGPTAIAASLWAEWFVWWANPLYFLGLVLFYQSDIRSKKFTLAATLIALSFLLWKRIAINEGGGQATIETLHAGYWLWIVALSVSTVGIFRYFKKIKKIVTLNRQDRNGREEI